MSRTIELPGYVVRIAEGALDDVARLARGATGAHRFAIITDTEVGRLYVHRIARQFAADELTLLAIPAGEREKTRDQWARLTDEMLDDGHGRDSAVIALGGGVVGDLAGFVAATYMRGIPFVQVPTTLLAMIDASVGGKSGVDTRVGKNLVGAFHRPAIVIADPDVLRTLPPEHLRAGMAEAIKHGVIADAAYLEWIVERLPAILENVFAGALEMEHEQAASAIMAELIARSIEIKARVVAADEREGGLRKILNFGHTLGHAVELLSGFELLHGEAVAIGMALESALAERAGIAASGTYDAVKRAVVGAGLPTTPPDGQSPEGILEATRLDKKARRGAVEYALPARIGMMAGKPRWSVPIDDAMVLEVLRGT